jgi:glycosyltransferase involved in cell wall biosynthesis
MNTPLVSVIIAVKNGERFIKTAIESVLAQTYSPLEILAVDGNSTDQTQEIIENIDKVKIINQTGIGIGNAYNTGISIANGEFIAFLSSDDYWMPNKIERQITTLQKQPVAAFAVCLAEFFLEASNFAPPGFRSELLDEPRLAYIMETLCARRSAFNAVGFFNEEMRTAEDVDWFVRAKDLQIESIVVPEVLLRKRIHDKNLHLVSAQNNRDLLRAVKNSINRKQNSLQ